MMQGAKEVVLYTSTRTWIRQVAYTVAAGARHFGFSEQTERRRAMERTGGLRKESIAAVKRYNDASPRSFYSICNNYFQSEEGLRRQRWAPTLSVAGTTSASKTVAASGASRARRLGIGIDDVVPGKKTIGGTQAAFKAVSHVMIITLFALMLHKSCAVQR